MSKDNSFEVVEGEDLTASHIIIAQEGDAMLEEPLVVTEPDLYRSQDLGFETADKTDMMGDIEPDTPLDLAEKDDFIKNIHEALDKVPEFSRGNLSSVERAIQYYTSLEKDIQTRVRSDYANQEDSFTLDELSKVEKVRTDIRRQLGKLEKLRSGLDDKMSRGVLKTDTLKKEATTPILTIVPDKFIHDLTRDLINGKISSGRDIEESFDKAAAVFKLNDREKYMLVNNLKDAGYPIHRKMFIDYGPDNYFA